MGRRRSYSDSESETSLSGSPSASDASDTDDSAQQRGRKGEQAEPGETEQNWVLCDSCTKWRRVPAPYANSLDEDASWYCALNPNKAFASCSVPQELTDEQIDAGGDSGGESELDEEEGLKRRRIPAVWQLLKDNVLTHRKRKVQDEDDIMICHCKPVWRGGDGCGPDCINRMLCIECVPGFCPSEDKCTNQMFSKRMYANLEIRRAGAKGFGLFALEDIKAGQFIIEYIGEVLEEDEYQRRKEYYMSVGQRHYYFMNIGNGEVIDACRKGNISRFINHSCEPNCETQKWLVHGELAIGLFAVRDIPKDTELTFDYNFERYGDKPMRCYCKSGGCRKFIGGTQDNFDVSLLPAVETVEDATHDWPPIMLGETDMDPNMRMLLDWRVGTRVDRPKEMGMVTRLERLCKARNVNWTVDYFYNPTFVPVQKQSAQPLILPPELPTAQAVTGKGAGAAQQQTSGGSGKAEKDKPGADSTPAPSTAKSKQQRKAEKAAATATAGKGKASAAKQDKQDKQRAEGGAAAVSKLQLEDGAAAGPGPGSLAQAMAGTPQFRGPKALFKQWKIMQQQDATPAPAVEEKPAAAPSSPPSPRSPRSQSPSPSQRSGGADAEAGLEDEDAEVEVRAAAAAAAKHAPLRKRLKRLPVKKPPPPAPVPEAPQQQNGSAAKASARKQSMDRSASPARSSSPPPAGAGRPLDRPNATGGTSRRGLRSEIDRRLDEVVGATGRLKDPSRQNIIKVLRLFNLCDMGHPNRTFGAAAGGRYLNGGRMGFGDDGGPGASSAGMTARQRARMADLSLLLDVVLKTTSSAAKKDFVTCGLLTQLHQAMGRNTGKEYCVILRKVLRVVEALPLEANDVYSVRSAHGNFADMLRQLSTNADYDVRTKAAALLKKFPPSAVTDQRLLQLMAAPPVRFGGMGRPGMGGMGMGGMGRFPSMMQQQMMQQQMMQQQMLKQQQMMRMKEAQAAAAAAAAAANAGGLPPPPPLGGGAAGSASGEGGAGGGGSADPALARTSSTASFGEGDPSELDGMGGGPMGLPPLGPGAARQRMMAAAAAMGGGRPGMMRNMGPGRQGMGPMGMGPGMGMMGNGMGPGGRPGMGMMGMGPMGMGPSPLGLPPRPPSPASAEAYAGYGSGAGGDDASGSAAKRRKYSHTGLDGADASSFGGPLPGPPPRHPYMGGQQGYGLHHGYPGSYYGRDGMDMDREPPGPPPLPPDLPLPPPPPLLGGLYGRSSSEERDLLGLGLADLPERLGVEQVFALARPRPRPPLLPPLQGTLQPERHLHGQLTDIVALFALGLYGSGNSAWGPRPGAAGAAASGAVAAAEGQEEKGKERAKEGATGSREKDTGAAAANGGDKEKSKGDEGAASAAGGGGEEGEAAATVAAVDQGDAASSLSDMTACCCWSPLVAVDGADVAMSPLVETAAAGTNEALPPPPPLPLPPGVSGNANGPPLGEGGVPLRPLRTTSTMGVAAAAGPSPYHTNSPAAYGGRDGPAPAGLPTGTNSTNSTPTVAGFGGAGGLGGPAAATATAAAAGGSALPPVVPISSLSDWRMPGGAADAAGAAAAGGATPAVARASPHASPEHQGAAAGGAAGQEENIDEWLRPVSTSHLEVWEEPDSSFEAYVADMVRHRLGKYMQPEHPSRVSVQEATALRAKVYREVVAKERRAWEERRSAGVFKPIERHKLESNLKEFVRSTIKRMRDREKEKGGVPAPAAATPVLHGGQHHSHGSHRHGGGHGGAAAGQGANPPTQVTSPSAPAVTPAAAKPVAAALPPAAPAAGQAPSASLPPRPSAPLVPEATEAAIATAEAPTPATAHPVVAAAEPAAQPAEQSNGGDVVAPGDHVMGEVEEEPLTPPEEETRAEAAAVRDVVMAVGS